MNVAEEKKNEKNFDNAVMGARREDEWTTCSGGVLLAGFRGVEISYNVRDVCVDSFNPLPRSGYRKPLLVGPSIRKTTAGELLEDEI